MSCWCKKCTSWPCAKGVRVAGWQWLPGCTGLPTLFMLFLTLTGCFLDSIRAAKTPPTRVNTTSYKPYSNEITPQMVAKMTRQATDIQNN